MTKQVPKPTLRTDVFDSRATTCVSFKAATLAILAMCLLVTSLSYGDEGYQTGMAAYQRGDYTTALKEFRPLAEQGNAEAQFQLGVMYHSGRGVIQDYVEAMKWYRKSAEQGHAKAQYYIGGMYYFGKGVVQDSVEAVKWYRKAAEQEHADAQHSLGLKYQYGRGVKRAPLEAIKWHLKAAEQGLGVTPLRWRI